MDYKNNSNTGLIIVADCMLLSVEYIGNVHLFFNKYTFLCPDQSTLEIIFVARRKRRQKPRRVFLLRAAENLAVITSYRPTNLFQASFELELHEGSYPVFTRPHRFEVLVLVNSRHFKKSDKKRYGSRVHLP